MTPSITPPMTQEEQIERTLRRFVQAGLVDHDPDAVLACLTEDFMGVGMGEQGLVDSLEGVRPLLTDGIKKESGVDYSVEYRNMHIHAYPEGMGTVCTEVIVTRRCGEETSAIGFMQSATMRRQTRERVSEQADDWKICHTHASPIMLSEASIAAYPLKFADHTLAHLRAELQSEAFTLINQSLPGGLAGARREPGYPLYFINDGMLEYLGYTREEFVEQTGEFTLNFIHADDREAVRRTLDEALESRQEYKIRHRVLKKDGSSAWMLQRGRGTTDGEGRHVILAVYVDVTEIVELQEEVERRAQALQAKNAELQAMTDNVPGGVVVMRLDTLCTLVYANPFFYRMVSYSPEQTCQMDNSFLRCLHPDDAGMAMQTILAARRNGQSHFEFETRLSGRDEDALWGLVRGSFLSTENEIHIHCVVLDITERKRMEQALRLSEERFRLALEKTSSVIFDYDIVRGAIMHSGVPKKTFDFTTDIDHARETLVQGGTIMPECAAPFADAFDRIRDGEDESECVVRVRLTDGSEAWSRISMTGIKDHLGRPVRAVGLVEDITRQKSAELAYAREEQYRQAVLADAMASYIVNFTGDSFEDCKISNPLCVPVKAGDAYESLLSNMVPLMLVEEDRQAFMSAFSIASVLRAFDKHEHEIRLEYRLITPDGAIMWLETTLRLILDTATGDRKGFIYVMDVDRRKREQLALTNKSERDPLTGAYNKGAAEARIRERLQTDEGIRSGVFMMLDVDHFKDINDTYGHPFGDTVLTDAARSIAERFRAHDIIGRLGGDEFCIFYCGMLSRKRVEEAAQDICNLFHKLYGPKTGHATPSCSIGIAMTNGVAKSFEQIYAEADAALYAVKKNGRDGYGFSDAAES